MRDGTCLAEVDVWEQVGPWSLLSLTPFGFCPQQGDKDARPQAPTAIMLFSGAWGQVTVD